MRDSKLIDCSESGLILSRQLQDCGEATAVVVFAEAVVTAMEVSTAQMQHQGISITGPLQRADTERQCSKMFHLHT